MAVKVKIDEGPGKVTLTQAQASADREPKQPE